MDQFQLKFIEEATDLINALESSVLALESRTEDQALINEIFRVMHSLKGGGAMFEFNQISEFTHDLENIYDKVRLKEKKVTRSLLDITLDSVDHLRNLLDEDLAETPSVLNNHKALTVRVVAELGDGIVSASESNSEISSPEDEFSSSLHTYYLLFKPAVDIFDNGTNPLYLVDEVCELGVTKAFARTHNIPNLESYNPVECHTYWEILIQTSSEQSEIDDVFMFVEDECEISNIEIAESPVLLSHIFNEELDILFAESTDTFEIDKIKTLAKEVEGISSEVENLKAESVLVKEKIQKFSKESKIASIRVSADKIDMYMNMVSELVTAQASLKLFSANLKDSSLIEIAENFENITTQMRDNALGMSLIPIENMTMRFRRLVRDLSQGMGKQIEFATEGTDTEIDKTLVEGLTDPLMHILRNSIDHGIESVEDRIAAGKSESGTITLRAYYSGSSVHIEIEDNGKGINTEKVRGIAIKRGLISEDEILTKKDVYNLIFRPGFSTAEKVTDVSGRGVGMDVVRRAIADLRGEIDTDSEVGKGTKITIKLPLTLSIIDGLLVRISDTYYIIPLSSISRIHEIKFSELKDAYNNIATIKEQQFPFYLLREELEIKGEYPEEVQFVLVKYQNKEIGLVFDIIEGEYQAVLKPLGKLYKEHDIIAGASILGDGTMALVLDTNKIIDKFSAL